MFIFSGESDNKHFCFALTFRTNLVQVTEEPISIYDWLGELLHVTDMKKIREQIIVYQILSPLNVERITKRFEPNTSCMAK